MLLRNIRALCGATALVAEVINIAVIGRETN